MSFLIDNSILDFSMRQINFWARKILYHMHLAEKQKNKNTSMQENTVNLRAMLIATKHKLV